MAQLALGVVGAVIGGYASGGNPAAIQAGFVIGSAIGGMAFAKTSKAVGPRIGENRVTNSTLGTPMTIVYGTVRISGNIIQSSDFREVSTTESSGGKGGGGGKTETTTFSYNADIAIDLAAGPLGGISKIWSDNKIVFDVTASAAENAKAPSFTFYSGSEDQLPDPTLEALTGVGSTPAYRGRSYVVFDKLNLPNGRVPQFSFLVSHETFENPSIAEVITDIVVRAGLDPVTSVDVTNTPIIVTTVGYDYDVGWVSATLPFGAFWITAVYGNGVIIVATSSGFEFVRSTDKGLTWSIITLSVSATWTASAFGNGVFIVTSDSSTIARSTDDGLTWSISNPPGNFRRSIAFGNGVFVIVVVNPAGSIRSVNGGLSWIAMLTPPTFTFSRSIAFGNGAFVAINGSSSLAISYDNGDTWLTQSSGPSGFGFAITITFGGGVFIVASDEPDSVYRSINGTYWVNIVAPGASYHYSSFGNGVFIITRLTGITYLTSTDLGLTWVSAASPTGFFYTGVIFADPTFVVAGRPIDYVLRLVPIEIEILTETVQPVFGYAITNVVSSRGALEPLLKAYFIDVAEADGKLKFTNRSNKVPIAQIGYNELGATDGDDIIEPFQLIRSQESDLPRTITIKYIDINSDYQPSAETTTKQITSSLSDLIDEMPISTISDHAKLVADVTMFEAWSARNARSGSITRKFANLTPGDVVQVEYPEGVFSNKLLINVDDTGLVVAFDAIDIDFEVLNSTPVGSVGPGNQVIDLAAGDTGLTVLDLPILRDSDGFNGIYVALYSLTLPWRGANLYLGDDDNSLLSIGSVGASSPTGLTESVLGDWSMNVIDEANTLIVDVGVDQLNSSTRAQILSGTINSCAIGEAGRWEILQFIRSAPLGNGRFEISGLKRGLRGTGKNRSNHGATDTFVLLLSTGLLRPTFEVSDLGVIKQFRGVTLDLPIDSATSISGVNLGIGLKPLSPYNLRASRNSNDFIPTWSRRTRLSDNWLFGLVPLGENSENYEIDVFTDGSFTTLVRTLFSIVQNVTYTSADQITDFGSNQSVINIRIYQISTTIGRGFYLEGSL